MMILKILVSLVVPDFSDGYNHGWFHSFDSIYGPLNIPDDFCEEDSFFLYFKDGLFNLFIAEINRFALTISVVSIHSCICQGHEMKAFIAI